MILNLKNLIQECFYEKLLLGAKENNEFSFEDKEENLLYYFKYDKEDLNSLGI